MEWQRFAVFTIAYTVNSTSATQGDVTPTNVSCMQSGGAMQTNPKTTRNPVESLGYGP